MIDSNIITGLISASGAYAAVWVHLKNIELRLSSHNKHIERLEKEFQCHSERLVKMEVKHDTK